MEAFSSQLFFVIKSNTLSVWKIKSAKENTFPLKISYSRVTLSVGQRGRQWVEFMPLTCRQQGPSWAHSPDALSTHPSRRDVETNMVQRPDWPRAAYPAWPWRPLRSKSHIGVAQTRPTCAVFPISFLYLQLDFNSSRNDSVTGLFLTGDTHIPFWTSMFAFLKNMLIIIFYFYV